MIDLIGLAASPRKGGNSERLLDELLNGASRAGAKVEKINLAQIEMHPCKACDRCRLGDDCEIRDELYELIPRLRDTQTVVLASPIHFYALSAHAQILISRVQRMWSQKYLRKAGDQGTGRGVLIAVGATRGPRLFDGVLHTARYFFDPLNKSFEHKLLVSGMEDPDAVAADSELLTQAQELGSRIVTLPKPERVRLGREYRNAGGKSAGAKAGPQMSIESWIELAVEREQFSTGLYNKMSQLSEDRSGEQTFSEMSRIERNHSDRLSSAMEISNTGEYLPGAAPADIGDWETDSPQPANTFTSIKPAMLCALKQVAGRRSLYVWLAKQRMDGVLSELCSVLADEESRQQRVLEELLVRNFIRY
ncbi:MAG: NAD(P)H-dependent oxidoreductase [Candidatus Alcyoniella australis]|nr:NAD(P)H-dependent oxidoreductase [Candidatus Alcyoniella australis]